MEHSAPLGGRTKSADSSLSSRRRRIRRLRALGLELGPEVDVDQLDLAPLTRASTGNVDADGQIVGRAA